MIGTSLVKTMIRKAIVDFLFFIIFNLAFQFRYLHENHYLIYYEEYWGKMFIVSPGLR